MKNELKIGDLVCAADSIERNLTHQGIILSIIHYEKALDECDYKVYWFKEKKIYNERRKWIKLNEKKK